MADFNARIFVEAITTSAEKAVKKLEDQIRKVDEAVEKINKRGFTGLEGKLNSVTRSVSNLGKRAVAVAGAGGIGALGLAINKFGQVLGDATIQFNVAGKVFERGIPGLNQFGDSIRESTALLTPFTDALTSLGPLGQKAALGIGALGAAAVVLGPSLVKPVQALDGIARASAGASTALRNALASVTAMAFGLPDITQEFNANFEAIAKAERGLGIYAGTIKKISQVQRNLKRTLDSLNSSTNEAAIVADKYVAATRRLNKEQAAQNNLLRQAQGLQPQEVRNTEVSRRESAVTSGRVLKQQKADTEALQRSLEKLERTEAERINALLDERAETVYQRQLANYQREQEALENSLRLTKELNEERRRGITRIQGPSPGQTGVVSGPQENVYSRIARDAQVARKVSNELVAIEQKYTKSKKDTLTVLKLQIAANQALGKYAEKNYKADVQALQTQFDKLQAFKQEIALAREAQRIQNARRRSQLGQDVLLGAGFPLLFGGGAGSVGGGLIGALAGQGKGGGFGLQIAASAIGQALDQFNQAATELGQALNPLTLDLSAVAKAAGVAGTETEALLKKVEETQGAYVAARLAADQLAVVIGKDGVDALKELGVSATELGNEASKAFAALSAAIAPALTAINDFLANTIQRSRLLSRAQGDFKDDEVIAPILARQGSNVRDLGQLDAQDAAALVARARELEQLEAKAADEKLRGAAAVQQTTDAYREQLDVLDKENAVINSTGSLLDEQTYIAERQVIFARTRLAVAKAENDENKIAIALKKEANALDALRARRRQEQAAKDKRDGKGARDADRAAQKEAQVQRNLAQLATRSFELQTKSAQLGQTKADQLAIEQATMTQLINLRRAEIQASTEDQRIKDARLSALQLEEQILIRQNELARDRLRIEENLLVLRGQQGVKDLERGLQQELSGITIPTGNRDLDERNALAAQQANRYTNALEGVNAQIKEQELLEQSLNEETSKRATFQLGILRQQKALYEEYLPAISAAEQQQLAFNQTFAKVKPIADAVAGSLLAGIRGVIDGTKTAEEAFKDFLNTIVDLLLKAAVEMIATYIAIGIAKQFAGIGGGTSSGIDDSGIKLGGSILGPKEAGGRTMANMPYVVGEKGAELFVPGKTGTIVPADVFEATRQAIAGNAPDGGDSDAFAQNSVALGNTATITKENSLVREMGMRENEPIDVRYESTVINNVSYVSEEQFQKGLRTAVAQSKSAVFSDLKNKPSARAGIGMR